MTWRETSGATLLEIVVAIGVMAAAAAVTWQGHGLLGRIALHAAAGTLVSDLRAAQARAMAERRPARGHGIDFAGDGSVYVRFAQEDGRRVSAEMRRLPAGVRITYARFGGVPRRVFFTGTSLLGAPSGGGTVTLAADMSRLCVRVLPATGRVRVTRTGCP